MATPQQTPSPQLSTTMPADELTREIIALKKQMSTMVQQIQSLASRVAKLDRDLLALAARRGGR